MNNISYIQNLNKIFLRKNIFRKILYFLMEDKNVNERKLRGKVKTKT